MLMLLQMKQNSNNIIKMDNINTKAQNTNTIGITNALTINNNQLNNNTQ